MEVMKVKNSMNNGELAYNNGEWQGSIPAHWISSKMILKPFERINAFDSNISFLSTNILT
jgi:hypothetical protein